MQNVLDSLIPSLLADKSRKFIYVEQVHLSFCLSAYFFNMSMIFMLIKMLFTLQ